MLPQHPLTFPFVHEYDVSQLSISPVGSRLVHSPDSIHSCTRRGGIETGDHKYYAISNIFCVDGAEYSLDEGIVALNLAHLSEARGASKL